MANEIWIVPFFGQGHLFPLMELCKQLASRNFKAVLVISSNLSSSVPSSLRQYPLVEIAEINETPSPSPPPPEAGAHPFHRHQEHHNQMAIGLEKLLSTRDPIRPVCAVLDMMMNWTSDFFNKFEIPAVSFFTSGACSAAMEYAMWKAHPLDVKPGETRLLPGLPEEMAITVSDLKRQSRRPPPFPMGGSGPPGGPHEGAHPSGPPRGRGKFGPQRPGPPNPGDQPQWLDEVELSVGVMINTCDELEHPFIEYLATRIEKPVWGVGPLLPDQYWKSAGSVLHDGEIRANRKSNITEDKVNEWLDAKPRGSVLYISFGSEVGPTKEEYAVLAEALEASTRPFIWVVQANAGKPGGPPRPVGPPSSESEEAYFPHGLDGRVGKRGLIIHGWAPQLMILSHPSTGGFLSHCGWNSTVEAIGRGVPFLAWPIRGDQFTNAKMVVSYLKVGYLISEECSEAIKKDEISKGIEVLLGDEEMKQRAVKLSTKFDHGFPTSSAAALDAFGDFVSHKAPSTH